MNKLYQFTLAMALVSLMTSCMFLKPEFLNEITAQELHRVMESGDVFLVDVHIPQQHHIEGTDLFIPFHKVAKSLDKFPADKSTAIFLYCKSGPMGNAAARKLYEAGYHNISNLKGGAEAWEDAGLPFESGHKGG